jgi:hypothetical protein
MARSTETIWRFYRPSDINLCCSNHGRRLSQCSEHNTSKFCASTDDYLRLHTGGRCLCHTACYHRWPTQPCLYRWVSWNGYRDAFLNDDHAGVPINITLTERIVAQVFCNDSLSAVTEFVTTSPLWMTKTAVAQVAGSTNLYYITLTWTPVDDQYGPQVEAVSM